MSATRPSMIALESRTLRDNDEPSLAVRRRVDADQAQDVDVFARRQVGGDVAHDEEERHQQVAAHVGEVLESQAEEGRDAEADDQAGGADDDLRAGDLREGLLEVVQEAQGSPPQKAAGDEAD